jgi:hypothetical protein
LVTVPIRGVVHAPGTADELRHIARGGSIFERLFDVAGVLA